MSTTDSVPEAPVYEALQRRPVTEVITDLITSRIETGALGPGDKLPAEPELARQLQVGRGSVREAIRTLHTLGVLQVIRGRGTFVAEPLREEHSPRFVDLGSASGLELAEILEVRIGLETAATSLACVRASHADLATMEARAAEHEAAVGHDDYDKLCRTDEAFHDAVVIAAHNTHLLEMYRMIVPKMTAFRRETLKLERSSQRFVPDHRVIIQGITNCHPQESTSAVVRHIGGLYNELRTAVMKSGSAANMLNFGDLLSTFSAET